MAERKTRVRFLGGPYDGLEFWTACSFGNLAPVAELPVSQDVLWALNGHIVPLHHAVQTVAVYVVSRQDAVVPYQFVKLRTVRPVELAGLDSWCSYVISSEAARNQPSCDETND